jgi:hypothetical protein
MKELSNKHGVFVRRQKAAIQSSRVRDGNRQVQPIDDTATMSKGDRWGMLLAISDWWTVVWRSAVILVGRVAGVWLNAYRIMIYCD